MLFVIMQKNFILKLYCNLFKLFISIIDILLLISYDILKKKIKYFEILSFICYQCLSITISIVEKSKFVRILVET